MLYFACCKKPDTAGITAKIKRKGRVKRMTKLKTRILALIISAIMSVTPLNNVSNSLEKVAPGNYTEAETTESETGLSVEETTEVTTEAVSTEESDSEEILELSTEEVTTEETETQEETAEEITTEEISTENSTEETTLISETEGQDIESQGVQVFIQEDIPVVHEINADRGSVSSYSWTIGGNSYSYISQVLGGTGSYWNENHSFLYFVSDDGEVPSVYCAEPTEPAPTTSTVFTEVFETDFSTAEGKKTMKYQGIMPFAYSGGSGSANAYQFFGIGTGRDLDYGGTYGVYVIDGVAKQGLMVAGAFYEMTEAEAAAVCATAIHKASGSDISSVESKVNPAHTTSVNACYEYLVELADYVYNQAVATGNYWEGLDAGNQASQKNKSIKYTYWVKKSDGSWSEGLPTGSQNGDFDWSPYKDSSGNVEICVRLESTGVETQLLKSASASGTTGNISYSHTTETTCNFDTSKNGYYDYFTVSEGSSNTVRNISVEYHGLSNNDVNLVDPVDGTAWLGKSFYQDAYITIPYSELTDGKVLDLNVESGTAMVAGMTNGELFIPVGRIFRASGYQDVVVGNYNQSASLSSTLYASELKTGSMGLIKVSLYPEVTDDNSCYDLTGAEYEVYAVTSQADTSTADRVGKFRIADNKGADDAGTGVVTYSKYNSSEADATGTDLTKTTLSELPLGWYMIKETKAPDNGSYELNPNPTYIQITSDNYSEKQVVTVKDKPGNDPVVIQIYKEDSEGNVKAGPSLAGAQFTIKYYAGYYDTVQSLPANPERTWVLETQYNATYDFYRCGLEDKYKVSGDALYLDSTGKAYLPLGTITIEETKAPDGYKADCTLTDTEGNTAVNGLYIRQITSSTGNLPSLQGGHEILVSENPERGGFTFTKVNYETRQTMSKIPFRLSYLDDDGNVVESHIIVTDSNGAFSTETIAHSTNTNGNDNAVPDADGHYDGLNQTGIWFSGSETAVTVDDNVGALPYGTYRLEELPCTANEGLQLIVPYEFTVTEDGVTASAGTISNVPVPEISTTEWDKESNTHMSIADNDVTVVDTISYKYLTAGKKYTAWGILVDKATGEALKDNDGKFIISCKVFTVDSNYVASKQEKCGEVDVEFNFDATGFEGESFVIYEYLYAGDTSSNTFLNPDGSIASTSYIAKHDDITDINQTGYFAGLSTKAWDIGTETNLAFPDEEVVVVDTVEYQGLSVGEEYKLEGKLIDKATGEALLDENGNVITAVKYFTPVDPDGSVDVTFPSFNASLLAGETIVVFENLYYNGKLYASHVDINDEDQSIHFPEVGTTAKDSVTGENISPANKKTTIVDKVSYENLIDGKTYTVMGTIMDKSSGEPLLDSEGNKITSSKTFVAEKASGTVEVEFTFDASLLQGKSVVVFEDIYYNGKQVATHSDINDDEQTIEFPDLKTTLVDKDTEIHLTCVDDDITLIDTVVYENLIVGEEYEIVGVLMNKDTNKPLMNDDKEVTASVTFTPENTSGVVEVEFKFDGIKAGLLKEDGTYSDIVAFETVYYDDIEFAVHADINDEYQTVTAPSGHTTARDDETGSHTAYPDKEVVIYDTFFYRDLIPGEEYTIKGILMTTDENGKAVPFLDNGKEVRGQTTFTPEKSEGEVDIEFKFDASSLQGKTIVCYEYMYYDDLLIFTHADINNKDQSINFPKLCTKATNKDGGVKEVPVNSVVTVVDEIGYENLTAGETYVVEGIIYDRSTNMPAVTKDGKNITSKVEFTPETQDGTVNVEFTFDTTGLNEKTLVVFEKIYTLDKGVVIGLHEDINSDSQAVVVKDVPRTGDNSPIIPIIALMGVMGCLLVGGMVILNKKRLVKDDSE